MAEDKYTHPSFESPGLEHSLAHSTEPYEHDKPPISRFPKMLYMVGKEPITVHNREGLKQMLDEGWSEHPIAKPEDASAAITAD